MDWLGSGDKWVGPEPPEASARDAFIDAREKGFAAAPAGGGHFEKGLDRNACNWTHWMNLLAYITSAGVVYLDYAGVFGAARSELDAKYQTLVTPAPWTSYIWVVIFAWEGVFAMMQLCVGSFRGSDVVEAVNQMWILTCACQILWFVLYSQELLTMSFAIASVLATTLLFLMARADVEEMTRAEYWLLRAPFSLHAGWALVIGGQSLNVCADALLFSTETLLALAYGTLICVLATVVGYQVVASQPDAIFIGVVVWAFGGIWMELSEPNKLDSPDRFNPNEWDRASLSSVRWTCLGCACFALFVEALAAAKRASSDAPPKLGNDEQD